MAAGKFIRGRGARRAGGESAAEHCRNRRTIESITKKGILSNRRIRAAGPGSGSCRHLNGFAAARGPRSTFGESEIEGGGQRKDGRRMLFLDVCFLGSPESEESATLAFTVRVYLDRRFRVCGGICDSFA
jgi:hypothetical protein